MNLNSKAHQLLRFFESNSIVPVLLGPLILIGIPLLFGRVLFWGLPVLQFIPWQSYAFSQINAGIFPTWNSLNGMGAPLLANYQLAIFYPPTWILYFIWNLGGNSWLTWANTLVVMLHLIWAGIGMTRLIKRCGLGLFGQTIGGISFSLSGYLLARSAFFDMVWVGSWLPWILYFSSAIGSPVSNKPSRRVVYPGIIFSGALLLLGGHAQLSYYILLLTIGWVAVGTWISGGWRRTVSGLAILGLNFLIAVMIASIQLVPTAEYLLQSQRSTAVDYDAAMTYSFWPWRFLTLLGPNIFGNPGTGDYWGYANYWEDAIYIGVLPLILALSTLRSTFKKPRSFEKSEDSITDKKPLVIFLWLLILITIPLALGKNTPIFPFLYNHIPTFSMFNAPARYMIWLVFSLSLLAAIGAEWWRRPTGKGLRRLKQGIVAATAITFGAFVTWISFRNIKVTFISATALTGLWGVGTGLLTLGKPRTENERSFTLWKWLAIGWLVADLLVAYWFILPTVPKETFQTGFGDPAVGLTPLLPNARIFMNPADEYRIKFSRFFRFGDFHPLEDWKDIGTILLPNVNLFNNIASANNFDPLVPGRYARWIKAFDKDDPKVLMNRLRMMAVDTYEVFDSSSPLGVKAIPINSLPRFRWVPCGKRALNEENAWELTNFNLKVMNPNIGQIQVVLEGEQLPGSSVCKTDFAGSVKVVSDRTTSINLEVVSDHAGWLVIADTWYPGWQANIDGESVPLYRADYLFRAVFVSPGKHNISLSYDPISIKLGYILCGIGLGFVILWVGWHKLFHKSFQ